jgi:hypothetical protein
MTYSVALLGHVTGGGGRDRMDLGAVTGAVTDLATCIVVGGEWKRGDWKEREEEREGGSLCSRIARFCFSL